MPSKFRGAGDARRSSKEAASSRKARVGRPMMQDAPIEKTDEVALRRERIRLAQRAYRNRRQTTSNTLKAKVARIELALEKTIKSFTKFQNFAIESNGLLPDVALKLSRTALEILNYSNEVRSVEINEAEQEDIAESSDSAKYTSSESNGNKKANGEIDEQKEQCLEIQAPTGLSHASNDQQGSELSVISKSPHTPVYSRAGTSISPQPSTVLFPWTYSHQNLTFTQRLRLACVERGFQLLSAPDISFIKIHPALSLHLKSMTVHELRTRIEQSLYGLPPLTTYGPKPPPLIHPNMYRTVEGSKSVLVNRAPSSDVERLAFGRTRTIVETGLPGFEGEWLEPVDVQEYLEHKGIFIGSAEPTNELPLAIPKTSLRLRSVNVVDSSRSEDTHNTRSMSSPWVTGHDVITDEVESFEGSRSSQVVTTGHPATINLPATQEEQVPGNWMLANGSPSQRHAASEAALTYFYTTVNLQQLIEYLALSAICLGPGPGMRKADVDRALKHSIAGF